MWASGYRGRSSSHFYRGRSSLLLALALCWLCLTPASAQTSPTSAPSELPSSWRSLPSSQLLQILAERLTLRSMQAAELAKLSTEQRLQIEALLASSQALEQKLMSSEASSQALGLKLRDSEASSTRLAQELQESRALLVSSLESLFSTATSAAFFQGESQRLQLRLDEYNAAVDRANADMLREAAALKLQRDVVLVVGSGALAYIAVDIGSYLLVKKSLLSLLSGR